MRLLCQNLYRLRGSGNPDSVPVMDAEPAEGADKTAVAPSRICIPNAERGGAGVSWVPQKAAPFLAKISAPRGPRADPYAAYDPASQLPSTAPIPHFSAASLCVGSAASFPSSSDVPNGAAAPLPLTAFFLDVCVPFPPASRYTRPYIWIELRELSFVRVTSPLKIYLIRLLY